MLQMYIVVAAVDKPLSAVACTDHSTVAVAALQPFPAHTHSLLIKEWKDSMQVLS